MSTGTTQTVLINAAQWAPPQEIPPGWVVANAPRPITGPIRWTGEFRHGTFYAAAEPTPEARASWLADDAWPVELITNAEIERRALAKLAEYGYATPEDAGMTFAELAGMLQLPYAEQAAQ